MNIDLLDSVCKEKISLDINYSVNWFLMGSYGYYRKDRPILTDSTYDWLARFIAKHWNEIDHAYKGHLDRESLQLTSSFELQEDAYPDYIKEGYYSLITKYFKPMSA